MATGHDPPDSRADDRTGPTRHPWRKPALSESTGNRNGCPCSEPPLAAKTAAKRCAVLSTRRSAATEAPLPAQPPAAAPTPASIHSRCSSRARCKNLGDRQSFSARSPASAHPRSNRGGCVGLVSTAARARPACAGVHGSSLGTVTKEHVNSVDRCARAWLSVWVHGRSAQRESQAASHLGSECPESGRFCPECPVFALTREGRGHEQGE